MFPPGQCIAVLEHPDYIKIQQDYLETKSQWELYKEDFKRQGELTVENASSIKTMQQAQASFKAIEVRLFALKSQLKLLGIDADSLHIGTISIYGKPYRTDLRNHHRIENQPGKICRSRPDGLQDRE